MKLSKLLPFLFIAFASAVMCPGARAQAMAPAEEYKFDIGVGLGMAGYLGDANESSIFSHPGVAFNGSFRYLANTRLALRGLLSVASLSGSTADMDNYMPGGAVYDFKTTLYDLSVRGEFNFFNYGIGESYKKLSRITPYLALGLGVSMASTGDGSFVAMSLPMSVGVKYKLRPRLNLGLEFTMNKIFGDKVDSHLLDDPYLIKSSFLKNTDWCSTIVLSISYEFGRRCVACNRQD
ncbi:MAG: porin family protein [Muribaculaceae bacterium]|nr:porin family protein [Muribaculaceae bacterium]